ncbi:TetR/AcrR family transcriptional regulator [Gordonia sp. HS-NH1]|uniref:TetR/AcrR family transcriptional regulator n=1 Tax=Gordonia sp. HS-NH1 TaxID=1435068 RepID=UPI000A00731D|nr:TetR/AcrR family transcriptional regulator [Gordonia sp. HS-NH1]
MSPTPTETTPPAKSAPDGAAPGTRERILSAAARVLSERGYAATRLSDIALRAGVHAPGVYHYFSSRDDLVMQVLREGQRRVLQHVTAALEQGGAGTSPRDRIMIAIDAHLRLELELSEFATAVTRNLGHVPVTIREALHPDSEAYHSLWRDLLTDAVDDGAISPSVDLRVARMMVIGALNWAPEWWHDDLAPVGVVVATTQSIVGDGLFACTAPRDAARPETTTAPTALA